MGNGVSWNPPEAFTPSFHFNIRVGAAAWAGLRLSRLAAGRREGLEEYMLLWPVICLLLGCWKPLSGAGS